MLSIWGMYHGNFTRPLIKRCNVEVFRKSNAGFCAFFDSRSQNPKLLLTFSISLNNYKLIEPKPHFVSSKSEAKFGLSQNYLLTRPQDFVSSVKKATPPSLST